MADGWKDLVTQTWYGDGDAEALKTGAQTELLSQESHNQNQNTEAA